MLLFDLRICCKEINVVFALSFVFIQILIIWGNIWIWHEDFLIRKSYTWGNLFRGLLIRSCLYHRLLLILLTIKGFFLRFHLLVNWEREREKEREMAIGFMEVLLVKAKGLQETDIFGTLFTSFCSDSLFSHFSVIVCVCRPYLLLKIGIF